MSLFTQNSVLYAERPLFDCPEEYAALVLVSVSLLSAIYNLYHVSVRLYRNPSSALIRLLFFVGICSIIALTGRILVEYVFYINFLSSISNITIGAGSIGFMITQSWTTKIFVPKIRDVTVRKIVALQVIVHLMTATPMYFKGTFFVQSTDPIFFAKWFKYTTSVWWAWCLLTDTFTNIWLAKEIIALSRRMTAMKNSYEMPTSKTTNQGSASVSSYVSEKSQSITPIIPRPVVNLHISELMARFHAQYHKTIMWMAIFSIMDVAALCLDRQKPTRKCIFTNGNLDGWNAFNGDLIADQQPNKTD
ncbi:hypothetical protein BATDEDRAFT_86505 [Batrachochytrium dendrobatidis JAM81]|uniref:Uncharacterized protein n=1 Tax=Batrachochytrium dendrobatidis (strain JAM81 / FGSC 10211) TaxID=684364 RepID=F4NXG4_BATDJ|nr:uncharacterized protein BATDEDRAFT_86505 [Batrachochytrium dendrobatidis JAM81]EGF82678.1 hypothetical protein BATDEDRAFT_86505 [Batrachochytrium dendrobatidis JAM81]|eukprot:XP_006677014.1 hypothetical protein BATDEDRAFT_86505 [Batrachochytrium dendrobatidis JAM81]